MTKYKYGLTVITGPSGVGKGTLVKKLLEENKSIWLSVSATTRLPREGEIDGKHYFFLKQKDFRNLVKEEGFLEWAEFAGNLYGTPREEVQKKLSIGKNVLLEIELDGARQIRKTYKDAFQIFIAPPNFEELEKRIRERGTDNETSIARRLKRAKEEMNAKKEFDAIVINDDLNNALLEIKKLIQE